MDILALNPKGNVSQHDLCFREDREQSRGKSQPFIGQHSPEAERNICEKCKNVATFLREYLAEDTEYLYRIETDLLSHNIQHYFNLS